MRELQRLCRSVAATTFTIAAFAVAAMVAGGHWLLGMFGHGFEAGYVPLVILAAGVFARVAAGPAEDMLNMTGNSNVSASTYLAIVAVNVRACRRARHPLRAERRGRGERDRADAPRAVALLCGVEAARDPHLDPRGHRRGGLRGLRRAQLGGATRRPSRPLSRRRGRRASARPARCRRGRRCRRRRISCPRSRRRSEA